MSFLIDIFKTKVAGSSMVFYEVLAGASLSLALAIPIFLDKVMRPRYEERFEEFKFQNQMDFVKILQDISDKVRDNKDEFIDRISDEMEKLINAWGYLKSNENKMNKLIEYRKGLFLGWMGTFILNILSIKYGPIKIFNLINQDDFSTLVFMFMVLISTKYVYDLFKLDDSLSKIKITENKKEQEIVIPKSTISSIMSEYITIENMVTKELDGYVDYMKNVRMKIGDMLYELDIIIPNDKNPKYIIEIKTRLSRQIIRRLNYRFSEIKKNLPHIKLILIYESTTLTSLKESHETWDYNIPLTKISTLKTIIDSTRVISPT